MSPTKRHFTLEETRKVFACEDCPFFQKIFRGNSQGVMYWCKKASKRIRESITRIPKWCPCSYKYIKYRK